MFKKKNIILLWDFKQFVLFFNNLIKRVLEAFYDMKTKEVWGGGFFSSTLKM